MSFFALIFSPAIISACSSPPTGSRAAITPLAESPEEFLDLPTSQPTLAPTPAPTKEPPISETEHTSTASSPASDQVFQSTVSKTSFGSTADVYCQLEQPMTLTLRGDDLAELVTTGPSVTDHYNCTTSTNETWYANGTTNTLDQTVTFTSCNFGGFSAEGTISFEDGTLSGYVTCFFKDGSIAVTITVK